MMHSAFLVLLSLSSSLAQQNWRNYYDNNGGDPAGDASDEFDDPAWNAVQPILSENEREEISVLTNYNGDLPSDMGAGGTATSSTYQTCITRDCPSFQSRLNELFAFGKGHRTKAKDIKKTCQKFPFQCIASKPNCANALEQSGLDDDTRCVCDVANYCGNVFNHFMRFMKSRDMVEDDEDPMKKAVEHCFLLDCMQMSPSCAGLQKRLIKTKMSDVDGCICPCRLEFGAVADWKQACNTDKGFTPCNATDACRKSFEPALRCLKCHPENKKRHCFTDVFSRMGVKIGPGKAEILDKKDAVCVHNWFHGCETETTSWLPTTTVGPPETTEWTEPFPTTSTSKTWPNINSGFSKGPNFLLVLLSLVFARGA